MRHVGGSRLPIQLHNGLGRKSLVCTPAIYKKNTSFRRKVHLLHITGNKIYKHERVNKLEPFFVRWRPLLKSKYSLRLTGLVPQLHPTPYFLNNHFNISLKSGATNAPGKYRPDRLFPGVKQPGRETDHSPPTSDEVKETYIYTSTPPYVFMA
jgi:hypothetical protein